MLFIVLIGLTFDIQAARAEDWAMASAEGDSVSLTGGRRGGGPPRRDGSRLSPGNPQRSGPRPVCRDYAVKSAVSSYDYENHGLGDELIPGHRSDEVARARGWRRCYHPDGRVTSRLVQPAAPGQPQQQVPVTDLLIEAARARVQVPTLDIVTSPPRRGPQLVSVPVWFWAASAQPVNATESITGLAATVTAKPGNLRIEVSGGQGERAEDNVIVNCDGPGTAYDRRKHPVMASSDCSHAFDWNGTFTITATLDWSLSWTATDGGSGPLAPRTSTTTFPLKVEQAQAVTD